ncbi:Acid-sensing ion channel 2 [Goodea atripinnis]|uniref:Acid-sensing ion channel 2 n=1 Tax=Goodea atripinnis TaxID=208336 RepID=A0ABV0NKS0_9TELE
MKSSSNGGQWKMKKEERHVGILAFASTSTLHGLRFIFPYGQGGARRLLWAATLLACLGLLALESAERLAYFLSYPHLTSVDAVVSSSLVFPAVTICNLNTYRFSRLTSNDLYHAGELLALLDVDLTIPQPHLAEPDVLASLQERTNFTAYKAKAFNMKEFLDRVGHDLKEMMLYCRYQGQDCSHSDFKTVSRQMSFSSLNIIFSVCAQLELDFFQSFLSSC